MTQLERIYYHESGDLPTDFLQQKRRILRSLAVEVRNDIAVRMDILDNQKKSLDEHVSMIEKYRNDAALRNSEGVDHVHAFNMLLSDLKRESRMLDAKAWTDSSTLRRELRDLMSEDLKIQQKERILEYPGR